MRACPAAWLPTCPPASYQRLYLGARAPAYLAQSIGSYSSAHSGQARRLAAGRASGPASGSDDDDDDNTLLWRRLRSGTHAS